jgi:hypothetical protein
MLNEYEFFSYISLERIDDLYQHQRASMFEEVQTQFKLKTPHEGLVKRYWASKTNDNWHRSWCLEWLYDRTRRPQVENLDLRTLVDCCKVHLEACLLTSYDACDLLEDWRPTT